jgi:hypothetical protein
VAQEAESAVEPLRLDDLQRGVLLPRLEAFLAAVPDPNARQPYLELKQALERLEVEPRLQAHLAALIEVILSSGGRLRREAGPAAEASLVSLFQKTPRGRQIAAALSSLNTALARLTGQRIESVSASSRAPGVHVLAIATEQLRVALRFEPSGATVESLEVAL